MLSPTTFFSTTPPEAPPTIIISSQSKLFICDCLPSCHGYPIKHRTRLHSNVGEALAVARATNIIVVLVGWGGRDQVKKSRRQSMKLLRGFVRGNNETAKQPRPLGVSTIKATDIPLMCMRAHTPIAKQALYLFVRVHLT